MTCSVQTVSFHRRLYLKFVELAKLVLISPSFMTGNLIDKKMSTGQTKQD